MSFFFCVIEACFLPKTIGSCNDKIPSWYYDVGSESCEAFTYGGCLGNNNKFVSKEECEQKCINLQPLSKFNFYGFLRFLIKENKDEFSNIWKPAIFFKCCILSTRKVFFFSYNDSF